MTRYRNFALFLVLAAVWGSAFMAIKVGLDYFPPVLFAALRYDVAGVIMLVYAVYAVDRWLPRTRNEWLLVLVGGALMIAAYHALLFVGETRTTSAAAAVIISLSPVLTTGFARLLLPSERLSPIGVVGLLLGLVGVIVLSRPDPANLLTDDIVAKLLVLGAGAAFALGSVLTRRIDADLPIETMEAWSMLLGALMMHAASLALPNEAFADIVWSTDAITALLYLSLAASAVGFLIYFDLLDRLGPIEINLVSYVAPLFAAAAGWLFLDEIIDAATVTGFLIIFAGFCLVKHRTIGRQLHLDAVLARD